MKVKNILTPAPLPGEFINSLLARMSDYSGVTSYRFFKRKLERRPGASLCRTMPVQIFDKPEDALDLTTWAYDKSLILEKDQEEAERKILESGKSYITYSDKNTLHYCPECMKKQISEYGTLYFLTLHQVEGLYVCPVHGTRLHPAGTNHFKNLIGIEVAEPVKATEPEISYAKAYLNFKNRTREDLVSEMDLKLTRLGLMDKNGFKKMDNLIDMLMEYYPAELLVKLFGNEKLDKKRLSKYINIGRTSKLSAYALIAGLPEPSAGTENIPKVPEKKKFEKKDIRYPEFMICPVCGSKMKFLGYSSRIGYYRCKCSCEVTDKGTLIQAGSHALKLIQDGTASGKTIKALTELTGLPEKTVSKIIRGQIDPLFIDNKIKRIENEFIQSPELCDTIKMNDSRMLFLKIQDRRFVEKVIMRNRMPEAKFRKKDDEMLSFLKKNEEDILDTPEMRSFNYFYKQLGVYNLNKDYYPKTWAYMEKYHENFDNWSRRRVEKFFETNPKGYKASTADLVKVIDSRNGLKHYHRIRKEKGLE